ncbi:MAG: DUF6263 family protein [Breznakibacter sp.]
MKKISIVLLAAGMAMFAQAQKVSMRYNLKGGSTFYANQTSVQNIHQDIMGNAMDIKVTLNLRTAYSVLKVENGLSTIDVTYESLGMNMESPMMNMAFDSAGEIDASNPMHSALSTIVGKKFTMVMDSRGKVASVSGFDKVMEELVAKFNGNQEMANQIAASLEQQFSDDAMKSNMEMMTAIFPENAVAIGDTWVVKNTIRSGMELNSENTLTLKDVANGKWMVSGVAQLATNSETAIQTQGMESHFSLTGTAKYEMVLDATTGWLIECNINQSIDGKVSLEGGQLPSSMEIPMKIESQTKTTSI